MQHFHKAKVIVSAFHSLRLSGIANAAYFPEIIFAEIVLREIKA